MIRLIVDYGSGDRKAPAITDPLIPDNTTAMIRAKQELAKSTYIVMTRTLLTPHDPQGGHAEITGEFSYTPLSIYGKHFITSRSISLSSDGARDTITIEQYREMVL